MSFPTALIVFMICVNTMELFVSAHDPYNQQYLDQRWLRQREVNWANPEERIESVMLPRTKGERGTACCFSTKNRLKSRYAVLHRSEFASEP